MMPPPNNLPGSTSVTVNSLNRFTSTAFEAKADPVYGGDTGTKVNDGVKPLPDLLSNFATGLTKS